MASIKVAIRCRPFSIDDKLGVKLHQLDEENGEVELINCDYSTTRFPFTYAWWSAYGFKRHLIGDNMPDAEEMVLIDQPAAYEQCGKKIKEDLLTGNAVVLFAYGLSGSGKTFTVFGPDAVDAPEAWFKWPEPHNLWGIFPRLAYEVFAEKSDGWKITMKYFQNVVDIVRDLMSANAEEQHYKNGMRKDPDGFMDIEWCIAKQIHSWNELRSVFQIANGRKAIAPTQFNPMSTRGHCIMTLEVEMPHPETEGMKQRGRVYVCDLAGTEPAGDIVYANYDKVTFDDGSFEYKYIGPHRDDKKTKELQDQGKKINLSLSEMAQFFMKMAEAVMKKKLKPGVSIPGCNSFFLCKYLKDTMLQAKTYLFCAIRPEVEFLKYTFATLGFAKNASVVKLAPKKATAAASPAERKLMAELEAMKALVEQLRAQSSSGGGGGMDANAASMIADLQAKLAAKQDDLAREISGEDTSSTAKQDEALERQRAEYLKRGISMVAFESDAEEPYFINLEEDAFRSNRLMYILRKEITIFGAKGDIQPLSFQVIKNHCTVKFDGESVFIIGGAGETFHNGHLVTEGVEEKIELYDRLVMGDQLMLFRWKCKENPDDKYLSPEEAVEEFQEGMMNSRKAAAQAAASGTSNANASALATEMEEERKKILEEREKWEAEKSQMVTKRNEQDYQRAMASVDNAILDLLPKAKEAKQTVDLLNRVTMTFDVVLEKGNDHVPKVKISVENTSPKLSILIEPTDFLPKLSLLKDEMMKLRGAIEAGKDYDLPARHDPLFLMFDNDFHLGTATHWPEYLLYNLETDPEEKQQDIKNAAVPYNTVGLLEVVWTPLAGPNEEDWKKPVPDIDSEDDLIGKSWTYRLGIKQASNLPVFCEQAYVEYVFFGETFTTECVEQATFSPVFDYNFIHHIDRVTPEFISFLKGSLEMHVHVTQHVDTPSGPPLGTKSSVVVDSIKTGIPKGYEASNGPRPKSDVEILNDELKTKLDEVLTENITLKKTIEELELKLAQYEGLKSSRSKSHLNDARLTDNIVNGE